MRTLKESVISSPSFNSIPLQLFSCAPSDAGLRGKVARLRRNTEASSYLEWAQTEPSSAGRRDAFLLSHLDLIG